MLSQGLRRYKDIISPKSRFGKDVLWNTLSFAVLGVGGIILNVLIAVKYGAETLGAFNQVYAVYIFASQLAVFGLYASVLKYVSEHSEDYFLCSSILASALLNCAVIAAVICFGYYKSIPFIANLLNSPAVAEGMTFSVVGLWCFSLNKILLAFLNGKRLMKAFALFNMFRFVMLVLSLIVFIMLGLPGHFSPAVFSVTESLLLICLLIYIYFSRFASTVSFDQCKEWIKIHSLFGAKSVLGGTVSEMNTRIDIFTLGVFRSDKAVGIYSLAAMFAEGIDQIPTIFRVNFNPLIVKFVVTARLMEFRLAVKKFFRQWTPVALAIGVLSVLVFPVLVRVVTKEAWLFDSWIVFGILIAGITAKSRYFVFWETPTQSGYPGWQTILIAFTTLTNTLLNFALIPSFGIYGAAIATTSSFVLSIFFLKMIAKRILNVAVL